MTAAARKWLPLFEDFVGRIVIDSKETGVSKIEMYASQKRFLEEVCDGLDNGIRHFVNLKARQLGISTISLAIDLFWLFVHPGLQGALITDTEENRDKFRVIITRYIESLPKSHRVEVVKHNRSNLVLKNGSVLDYVVAGTRKGKGGLGRSRAWNFVHATECSSYADAEGLDSMVASLAQKNPNRLYIFESTARGYNIFWDMWEKAGDDDTQKRFFIGWWAKDDYAIERSDPRFAKYMDSELEDGEREKVAEVKKLYGVDVSDEQIAWHRWYSQTHISSEGMMDQEFPWTEDQAFVLTGQSFFPQRRIAEETKRVYQDVVFKGYRYHLGEDFRATEIEQVQRAMDADLRIWEEPDPLGWYTIGCDPAFGSNEWKDRHAIQILRCYADRTVQVAEYASSNPQTYQLTWVLCHLAGAYRNCMINMEINGPGSAVMTEMRHLKQSLQGGFATPHERTEHWADIFSRVRWYLYNKPDSMGAGFVYNWKTNVDNKMMIMNQLRDQFALKHLVINSLPCLEEMRHVVQDGVVIEAQGRAKDDRAFSLALANHAYIRWLRGTLSSNGETYEKATETAKQLAEKPQQTMTRYVVAEFFKEADTARFDREEAAAWE